MFTEYYNRMKSKGFESSQSIPFEDVFGSNWFSYFIPIPPTFTDETKVFGYILRKESFSNRRVAL